MQCECCKRRVSPGIVFCPWCSARIDSKPTRETPGDLSINIENNLDRSPANEILFGLFSTKGRLNRLKYLYVLFLFLGAITLGVIGLNSLARFDSGIFISLACFVYVASWLLSFTVLLLSGSKREHDIYEDGDSVWKMMYIGHDIPSLIFSLMTMKSCYGPNSCGDENHDKNFYWQAPLVTVLAPALMLLISCFLPVVNS